MEILATGQGIEMVGESASIMAALQSPPPEDFPAGGMKYWDDADEGEGVSHGCINLDLVNCELSGAEPLNIDNLQCSYRVFLSGPTGCEIIDLSRILHFNVR